MARLVYVFLLGLVGAAIVHIAIIVAMPLYSERDPWTRLSEAGSLYDMMRIGDEDGPIPGIDPLFEAHVCMFDLSEGVAHLKGEQTSPFWSASVYDHWGRNTYSFTDRTAGGKAPDIAIVTAAQLLELRKELPENLSSSVFVEVEDTRGIVLLRSFRPDPTYVPKTRAFFDSVSCGVI